MKSAACIIRILPWLLLAGLGMITGGCQTSPTRVAVYDTGLSDRAFKDIKMGDERAVDLRKSIIVDTRPRFQYELSRPPRSHHFFWKDWELFKYRGSALIKRREELQRRLARKGIDPLTSVVIFGDGRDGVGEEYYIAAVLFALGIDKITVTSPQTFARSVSNQHEAPIANVPYWNRELRYDFSCYGKKPGHRIVVMSVKALLDSKFKFSKRKILKHAVKDTLNAIEVTDDLFAYGMAMTLLENDYPVCVDGV